ncbi:MAG: D-tyrosyl-tRNA(Tyr) deacylase [Planctomycetota bacterium]|jgi:D-tyrosyl-tRNA(Tyr) deacylase|nr:D-tyrosyl-tRNA(Tyr) deacylase [Planctomycetota bacterium]
MRAVVQRVAEAGVRVDGELVGAIGAGLLVLLGVAAADGPEEAALLAGKVARLRIFRDAGGRMNLALPEAGGKALVVSQFTLCADLSRGNRPSFAPAARPEAAKELYEGFCRELAALGLAVEKGVFGAHMEVRLLNDGPVTIVMDTAVWR